jgi:hypothetical protein
MFLYLLYNVLTTLLLYIMVHQTNYFFMTEGQKEKGIHLFNLV